MKAEPATSNQNSFSKKEKIALYFGFALLWTYLIIRSHTVFLITDEIVTKWSYMIDWNPLPYMGYIDANNHFLNSFLGGLFYRIFHSDASWVIRLPNILAFPLFFWSAIRFAPFFRQKINFYGLLIVFTCSAFIIEYFALARGYGLSIALFVSGIQFLLHYIQYQKKNAFYWCIISFLFACYSNMSLVPLILMAFVYLGLYLIHKKTFTQLTFLVAALVPIFYAIQYSFHLKEIGKLYYGGENGFYQNTLHSLTQYFWNTGNFYLDIALTLVFLGIVYTAVVVFTQQKSIFNSAIILYSFCIAAVANILAQHYILGVKFPEDRAAIYLPLLFFIALFIALDHWRKQWPALLIIGITGAHFVYDFNIEKSKFFYYEHFDEELISSIPESILGTPPTTGARFWKMDNERMRQANINSFAFQNTYRDIDTLHDYIISTELIRPDLPLRYTVKYQDPISKLTLFERKKFLKRELINTQVVLLDGDKEYFDFANIPLNGSMLFRITGTLFDIDDVQSFPIVVSTENHITRDIDTYDGLNFLESCTVNDKGEIHVDMSFAVGKNNTADTFKSYIWNRNHLHISGQFKVEIYRLYN
tara:strand:+ start:235470 stop:237236 length:1767 start_codon:yes stop_codon:yes gene_type:complete